jgi:hypothetical protein
VSAESGQAFIPLASQPTEWTHFRERNARFVETMTDLDAAVAAVLAPRRMNSTGEVGVAVYFLAHACVADFREIVALAENGLGFGALKLVRGMYERVVTARHLHQNPNELERFIAWESLTEAKMASAVLDVFGDGLSEADREKLQAAVALAKHIREERKELKCTTCGKAGGGAGWSKLDLVTMAKKLDGSARTLLIRAYYEPTRYAHATFRSFDARTVSSDEGFGFDHGPQHEVADRAVFLGHTLLLDILDLAEKVGRPDGAESMTLARAGDAYREVWSG